jgi:hypothetical protein
MRLDYAPKTLGELPAFSLSADAVAVIRFKTTRVSSIEIPYGKDLGGTASYPEPATGNGFLGSVNGKVVPEFKISDQKRIPINEGMEIFHVNSEGTEDLIAVYNNNRFNRPGGT